MKQITSRLVGLLFICLISGFAFTNVYAKTMGEKRVRVHGSWDEEKRSVSPDIPIIVILDNDELIIQSSSLRSDITIRIMDSSTMVYEETVLAEKTGYILIDLKDNKSGVYQWYLQPIITQYFIDNKSEIWLLFLIAHSKR